MPYLLKTLMRKLVSGPEIRIIATPEAPIPVDKAQIVINILYIEFYIRISLKYIMIIWLASYPKSGNTWLRNQIFKKLIN